MHSCNELLGERKYIDEYLLHHLDLDSATLEIGHVLRPHIVYTGLKPFELADFGALSLVININKSAYERHQLSTWSHDRIIL